MKQTITILKKLDKITYRVQFLDKSVKELKQGVHLDTPLVENSRYEVEIHRDFINKATLVRNLEKVSQNEYKELIDLIKKKESELQNIADEDSLKDLLENANIVASNCFKDREWDYDLFERISNEVYLRNLNRFVNINNME